VDDLACGRNTMAKKKFQAFIVNYKDLVREVRKTLKTLKKIEKKVRAKQKADIAVQIKSLNYLIGVCTLPPVPMSKCTLVPPPMSKCNLVPPKMSKRYTTL
jgi:hypothetical protein